MLTDSILILDFPSFQIVQDEPVCEEPAQLNEVNSESQFEFIFLLDFCSTYVN